MAFRRSPPIRTRPRNGDAGFAAAPARNPPLRAGDCARGGAWLEPMANVDGPAMGYLDQLNAAQRAAVEHGVAPGRAEPGRPLLIIAGAGTGKTTTLAHRVAHLILNGADPRRILLLTFGRRMAAEMIRRV